MALRDIVLYNHRGNWTLNERQLKDRIKTIIDPESAQFRYAEVYLMRDSSSRYETGGGEKLHIFIGATPGSSDAIEYALTTDIGTYGFNGWLPKDQTYAVPVMDASNQILGFYNEKHAEYYIPYTLDDLNPEDAREIILYSIKGFANNVLAEYRNHNSWVKTKNKESLLEMVKTNLSQDQTNLVNNLENRIRELEQYIQTYTRELKGKYDQLRQKSKELANAKNGGVDGLDNFIKGLDLIAQHPQVSNLIVEGNEITAYIDKVYAYADIDGEEKRFYIGNMHIKMNIANTEVKFFGDNPRRGFWAQDPHPHVNGSTGDACLGNVSATIAQLCSQKEIYPLFLTCLDFLENANTDDPAGEKIVMWDEVDEEGNIIHEGGERGECFYCDNCEEHYNENRHDQYTVYTRFEDGTVVDPETWCNNCRGDRASYNDHVHEYVHDDIVEEIDEHFKGEE
jgi:hypothetical protein